MTFSGNVKMQNLISSVEKNTLFDLLWNLSRCLFQGLWLLEPWQGPQSQKKCFSNPILFLASCLLSGLGPDKLRYCFSKISIFWYNFLGFCTYNFMLGTCRNTVMCHASAIVPGQLGAVLKIVLFDETLNAINGASFTTLPGNNWKYSWLSKYSEEQYNELTYLGSSLVIIWSHETSWRM